MKVISNAIRFFFLLISFFSLYVIGAILYVMATEHHFPDQLKLSEDLELVQAISDTTFEFISWNIGKRGPSLLLLFSIIFSNFLKSKI